MLPAEHIYHSETIYTQNAAGKWLLSLQKSAGNTQIHTGWASRFMPIRQPQALNRDWIEGRQRSETPEGQGTQGGGSLVNLGDGAVEEDDRGVVEALERIVSRELNVVLQPREGVRHFRRPR
jgi:uncharacterized protein RhaS with RHS repeats